MSQHVILNTKHVFSRFFFPPLAFELLLQVWNHGSLPNPQIKFSLLASEALSIIILVYFMCIWLFLLWHYALLKRHHWPRMQILSDGCNGRWLSSWGWHFQRSPLCWDRLRWAHRAGGHRAHEDIFAPESSQLHCDRIWQSINRPLAEWGLLIAKPSMLEEKCRPVTSTSG